MVEDETDSSDIHFGATDDHSSSIDKLGFKPYVDVVHQFLTHDETNPPLTLSIEGEWGSGKSSFMDQLRDRLEKEGKTTVEFNPWIHEQQKGLWASFATSLVESLKKATPIHRKFDKYLLISYRRLRSGANNVVFEKLIIEFLLLILLIILGMVVWFVYGIEEISAVISGSNFDLRFWLGTSGVVVSILALIDLSRRGYNVWAKSINQSFEQRINEPSYQEHTEFLESFQSDLELILDVYAGEDPVYVFMDDVDRCAVPKAADLMRSINLMISSDCQIIFIIGLDRERVAAGIAAKHDTLLEHLDDEGESDDAIEFGYRYLEKFIQVPFVVPKPKQEDIQKLVRGDILDENVTEMGKETNDIVPVWEEISPRFETSLDEIINMASMAFNNNPRQVKRFFNLYRLRVVLAELEGLLVKPNEEPLGDTITLFQLAKFVIISVRWPSFITTVANDQTALERISRFANGSDEDLSEHDALQEWSGVDNLLDLLSHGEGSKYRMDQISVVDLQKISPRVDRPTQSDKENAERTIQIAFFADAEYNPESIQSRLRSVSETLDLNLQLRVFEDAKQKPIEKINQLHYCFIWIVDPNLLAKTWFQRLCQNAPEQLQIISLNSNTEFIDPPVSIDMLSVDSPKELSNALEQQLKTIDASDESGNTKWEEWQHAILDRNKNDETEIID